MLYSPIIFAWSWCKQNCVIEPTSDNLTRVALGIEYDGNDFHGWQLQAHDQKTVQGALERALSVVADHPVRLFCAGRTDSGVHATEQVVHFDTSSVRDAKAWIRGTNAHLPDGVRVRWARDVAPDFHARFSATARRYLYVIDNRPVRPAIMNRQLSWHRWPLDVERMHEAGQYLLGENDFSSYRAAHCQSNTPFRNVHHLNVQRRGSLVIIDIKANAFLYHMVRNITGMLLTVGEGRQAPVWAKQVLEQHNRCAGGVTAPPNGLYLVGIDYPDEWGIPTPEPQLPFLMG